MKINGQLIASEIKKKLKQKIIILRKKGVTPHLAVVLVGNDPSSLIYIRQKQKVGEEIGVKVSIFNFQFSIFKKENAKDTTRGGGKAFINLVQKLNNDPSAHGIIIQRPVPIDIEKDELDRLVVPHKDVDGFHPDSPFTPPIALAVLKILEWIYKDAKTPRGWSRWQSGTPPTVEELNKEFISWLKKQKILIIGRGETAGKPIAKTFKKMCLKFTVANSQTTNLKRLCLSHDIIISCVGKRIVRHDMVTSKTILIGVGLHKEHEKLLPDYDQEAISWKVAYFTPVPGGVGPVNVACLFENLLKAASS